LLKSLSGTPRKHQTLHNLLTALFVTDFAQSVKEEIPGSLRHFILPKSKQANAVVCLGQWRDSTSKTESYDVLSELSAQSLNIKEKLSELSPHKLFESVTFLEIEKIIASYLKDIVIETEDTMDAGSVKEVARKRQDMHWANCRLSSSPDIPRNALFSVYTAIIAAADFFASKIEYNDSLNINDPEKIFKSYTDSYIN